MPSTLEKLDKNFVSIELTTSTEEIDEALEQAYHRVVKKINIPGFRKGKVPRRIIEAQYGKGILYEDAVEILVAKKYDEAIKEHGLVPVDQPHFDVVEPFEEGKPFVIKAKVEVLPEVKLGEYKGLKVAKPEVKVTPEQVEERLQSLRERHSELVVSDKKVLEKGDFAIIDFEGFLDGKPFPGGAGQGYTLEIGSGTFIPGFEDAIIGMETGMEREINLTFPEDYHVADLAGKPVVFKVNLREIKVKELPELDGEFAKVLGYESMEQLREELGKRMEEAAIRQRDAAWEEEVVAKAVENATVEISDTLVERQTHRMIHEFEQNLAYQGLTLDSYLKYAEKDLDTVKQEFRPGAEKRVKTDLVIDAIAKAEGLEPTEEEVDAQIEKMLAAYPPKDKAKMEKEMKKPSRRDAVKDALRGEKAVRFVIEQAVAE
ncbi:MAG: trigger factor [Bacillota bacterium]|jgi:trigger factor